jgi:hypothetical protein
MEKEGLFCLSFTGAVAVKGVLALEDLCIAGEV